MLAVNPVRRPLVWLPRDLKPEEAETEAHQQFLKSLLDNNAVELLRTGFEDLKDEIPKRMRPRASPALKMVRRPLEEPIIHIWHHIQDPTPLGPLKSYLKTRNCGISVFLYSALPPGTLQSKLAFCDGLIVSYLPDAKSWAEDVIMEAFQLRRREERPLAYAAVQLPPPSNGAFNFEHPRVVAVQGNGDQFQGIDDFLGRLEESGD